MLLVKRQYNHIFCGTWHRRHWASKYKMGEHQAPVHSINEKRVQVKPRVLIWGIPLQCYNFFLFLIPVVFAIGGIFLFLPNKEFLLFFCTHDRHRATHIQRITFPSSLGQPPSLKAASCTLKNVLYFLLLSFSFLNGEFGSWRNPWKTLVKRGENPRAADGVCLAF